MNINPPKDEPWQFYVLCFLRIRWWTGPSSFAGSLTWHSHIFYLSSFVLLKHSLSWLSITLPPLTDHSPHSQPCGVDSTPLLSTFYPTWVGGEWVGGGADWTWPSCCSTSSHYEPSVNFSSLVSQPEWKQHFQDSFDGGRLPVTVSINWSASTQEFFRRNICLLSVSINLTQICSSGSCLGSILPPGSPVKTDSLFGKQ